MSRQYYRGRFGRPSSESNRCGLFECNIACFCVISRRNARVRNVSSIVHMPSPFEVCMMEGI